MMVEEDKLTVARVEEAVDLKEAEILRLAAAANYEEDSIWRVEVTLSLSLEVEVEARLVDQTGVMGRVARL